jgi:hypothetical protein
MTDKTKQHAQEGSVPSDCKPKRKKTGGRVKYTGSCALCGTEKTNRWYKKMHPSGTICGSCYGKERRKNPEILARRKQDNYRWQRANPYKVARKTAKAKGTEFTLTEEQYNHLINHDQCYYCGSPLAETGMKLDRVDNCKGYSLENAVPCCSWCNIAKNKHTQDYFIDMCKKVADTHK